ncbi:hypothetical protein B0H17DRAFT_1131996 [Mycena rosella]|uniref:Uncharacterized protein n=1 Tax=Mycena rosella TaxID=1033263 RepID=A0AAD7DL77_MYCRO|nr:hypothetical protein B0H17DRAFT_1131996 [Mycena rosella]
MCLPYCLALLKYAPSTLVECVPIGMCLRLPPLNAPPPTALLKYAPSALVECASALPVEIYLHLPPLNVPPPTALLKYAPSARVKYVSVLPIGMCLRRGKLWDMGHPMTMWDVPLQSKGCPTQPMECPMYRSGMSLQVGHPSSMMWDVPFSSVGFPPDVGIPRWDIPSVIKS